MAFPAGWPPTPPSGIRNLRVYFSGVTTAAFTDNAYLFYDIAGANPFTPLPVAHPQTPIVVPKTPWGSGRNANDANHSAAAGLEAVPKPQLWASTIRVMNDGGNEIEISFDGTIVQGVLKAGEKLEYRRRAEAGIAIRSTVVGLAFRVEAW